MLLVGALAVAACGSDSGGDADAAIINTTDAAPPDAVMYDAFVCVESDTQKACGAGMDGCVNITRDNMHCGGCDMACTSPGQACVPGPEGKGTEIAHCECPPMDFVPGTVNGIDLSDLGVPNVTAAGSDYVGIGIYGTAETHALLVTFNLTAGTATPVGEDIDLSAVPSTATAPRFAAGYNVDLLNQSFQTAFLATTGTLNLDHACLTGLAGTLTNATFVEVDTTTFMPIANGCGFSLASVAFTIGDDCGGGDMDGGI
jgi:hypothetical protein